MRRSFRALAAAGALLLPACAWLGSSPELQHHAPVATPAEKAYATGVLAFREGAYERALDQFALSWKEEPDSPAVSREFVAALEGLKKSADEAARQDQAEEAAKRWSAVLRYAGHPATKGKTLSFARPDVKAGVDRVSAGLMEKGLKEYRAGNLDAAIEIWRSILAFDPGNAEAAKSIKTATTQLENLKKLPPPPPAK